TGRDRLARAPGDGRTTRQRLEAAPVAAWTSGPARIDGLVTDLPCRVLHAAMEPAAEDQTGADPGGERHVHQVVDALPRAEPVLTNRRRIAVVLEDDRHLQLGLEHRHHGQ